MFEVTEAKLKKQIIQRVIEMKNGNEKCTPQPDAARYALQQYHAMLPEFDLMNGVREALKK